MLDEDRIKAIEEEIRTTPYHKGTEHHIGRLKARIAKIREEMFQKRVKSSGGGGGGKHYAVRKTGNASVVLVGPPSVGKSTLINRITNAQSKTAAYEFTTIEVVPGMLDYQGAKIQIFDVPGIIEGASSGKGRGKEVLSVIRTGDLIIIMVDICSIGKIDQVKSELYNFGIRLDENKPNVFFKKTSSGGIKVLASQKLKHLSVETIKELASEFHLRNAEIIIKENITLERLIDAFLGNRCYLPYVVVVNKIDACNKALNIPSDYVSISAKSSLGLELLKKTVWDNLELIRVYLKPEKGEIDFNNPLVVKKNISLKKILEENPIPRKELVTRAIIYGPGAKFPGQEVSLSFVPLEGTVIFFL